MRTKRVLASAAALMMILAGCSKSDTSQNISVEDTAGSSSVAPTAINAAMPAIPAGLEEFYSQKLEWEDCSGLECAKVKVPLDYQNPSGEVIELAVKRYAAEDEAIGSILVNPGGPGGSGQEMAEMAGYYFSDDVRSAFNIVGFDPRGVGESTPVECLDDQTLARVLEASYPDTPEGDAAGIADLETIVNGCKENSGELLNFVGTESAARDMDVLRHLMGDPKLYYVGFSYGTSLGGMYADLFPKNVGRMILDGAVSPTATNYEANAAQLKGFEDSLDAYLDSCLEQESGCPFSGTKEDARSKIIQALNQMLQSPASTIYEDRKLTQTGLMMGIITALYDNQTWTILSRAFTELFTSGDGSTFLLLFDAYTSREGDKFMDNSTEANWAINCADTVVEGDTETWAENAEKLNEISPVFGPVMGYDELMCEKWPYRNQVKHGAYKAAGSDPIVVVGTVGDPATPYQWAVDFAKEMENSVLVTYEGEGHTAYGRSTECVSQPLDKYLLTGEVPEAVSCPAK